MKYIDFLKGKMAISHNTGFEIKPGELTTSLYPHVKDTVRWAVAGGCRAIFSSFGMQKTVTQLEILRVILNHKGGKGLIVCPKRVVVEFLTQAEQHLRMKVTYVRTMADVMICPTDIMVTNYERVRDGEEGVRIDPAYFTVTSLDEASVLRGFGTKTYQEFLPLFSDVPYRFVATATPSPNRYKELIHYAGYLGVMDTGQALTRFFQRDSTKANNLTLYPHKEKEFWLWVSTWALFLTKPSDLGYPDTGYELPELRVHEEIVSVDNSTAGTDRDGQVKMFREAALGLADAAKERRDNMEEKIARVVEIINRPENKDDHFLLWHDLESERISEMTVFHYMKHGFRYMGRITVDTDVVRENNQTYRLGYTEMCKDGSKMGIGCPEYVLLFRKLPTDTSRAYADQPVTKDKSEYSLARWQIDAHASWKSSGNSLLSYEDMKGAGIDKIRHLFRNYEREHIYNYEEHVSFAEELEAYGKLPKTFMAVDPVSKKDWIWDDVVRMRTLNTRQSQKKRQNHICPLQLDIVERLIERYSNKGELIFDPFGGIGTVPYCAVKLGRKGLSTELNYDYWKDGLTYLREIEMEVSAPTLFDLIAM